MLSVLFSMSLFLSALLLFSIQPMVAKALLPVYGGTPAVWIVCMLFFQLILLGAYAYSWLLSFMKKSLSWRGFHAVIVLLSLAFFPYLFHPEAKNLAPEWEILSTLFLQTGLPLLVIGASAPLLQFAYSQTRGKGASDPYFLYVISNLGSLGALLLYPWVIERFIGLNQQFYVWNIVYVVYICILLLLLFVPKYLPIEPVTQAERQWPWSKILYWIALSFVPCSLMLGVTLYITTDVAATPLFWVLPLALYLFSFVLSFSPRPFISQAWLNRNYLFFLVFTILGFILGVSQVKAWQIILVNLSSFFVLALICHGQLYQRRPQSQLLTLFYFCLAIGGVLAGIFNGILAPHWFNIVYEYPIVILLSLLVLPMPSGNQGWWVPAFILSLVIFYYFVPVIKGVFIYPFLGIAALVLIVTMRQSKRNFFLSMVILFSLIFVPILKPNHLLVQKRNFYGVKQVEERKNFHALISQSTLHGLQVMDEKAIGYRAYYGPLVEVIEAMNQQFPSLSATILGLGAGTLLCQFRAQDRVHVIEIDEQMIAIAKNPKLFTYLKDCLPKVEITKNDGRLALTKTADFSQNIFILDAFNSDAIPVHLMTVEAFALYQKKMTPDGVILVNLSNRHVDLLPVVNASGALLKLKVFYLEDTAHLKLGQLASNWALLTANPKLISQLEKTNWLPVEPKNQFLWTDDYSNIIPVLKW